jgi:Ran GTPase-activating protein (RanGAP) involved in mRNA processing and transport
MMLPQKQISNDEARRLIARAASENWADLTIIGTSWREPAFAHDRSPNPDHVIHLYEALDDRTLADLDMLPRLKHLQLKGIKVGLKSAKALAKSLGKLPSLLELVVRNADLGPEGAHEIAGPLEELEELQKLDLGSNDIRAEGAIALAAPLRRLRRLTALDLSFNMLRLDGMNAISASLDELEWLDTLDLGGNNIGPSGGRALEWPLSKLRRLRFLSLWNNALGPEGAAVIAKPLAGLTQLRVLELGRNHFGEAGSKLLAESIAHLTELQTLSFECNKCGREGGEAFAKALVKLTKLEKLRFWDNELGLDVAHALAESLQKLLPTLHELDLTFNSLGIDQSILRQTTNPKQIIGQILAVDKEFLLAVKAVVLGDSPDSEKGRLGKTCLCRRLVGEAARHHENMTTAIDRFAINPPLWATINGRRKKIDVTLFDFGGQRRLLSAHRFFVAIRRHIYIVCGDARKTLDDSGLRRWVRFINDLHIQTVRAEAEAARRYPAFEASQQPYGRDERFGGPSLKDARRDAIPSPPPTILVTTWSESPPTPLLEEPDKQRLERLVTDHGAMLVSPYDNFEPNDRHLKTVRDALEAALTGMPELGGWVSLSLFQVRAKVKRLFEQEHAPASMSIDRFKAECIRTVHELKECTEQDVAFHLKVLRDLGDIHWVGDRDDITPDHSAVKLCVFNPHRICKPVYRALWGRGEHMQRPGFVSEQWIHSKLERDEEMGEQENGSADDSLDNAERTQVIELMRLCGLIFPVEVKEEGLLYLVPDHLSALRDEPPPERSPWERWGTTKKLDYVPDYLMPCLRGHFVQEVYDHPEQSAAANRFFLRSGPVDGFVQLSGWGSGTFTIAAKGGNREQRASFTNRVIDQIAALLRVARDDLKFSFVDKDSDAVDTGPYTWIYKGTGWFIMYKVTEQIIEPKFEWGPHSHRDGFRYLAVLLRSPNMEFSLPELYRELGELPSASDEAGHDFSADVDRPAHGLSKSGSRRGRPRLHQIVRFHMLEKKLGNKESLSQEEQAEHVELANLGCGDVNAATESLAAETENVWKAILRVISTSANDGTPAPLAQGGFNSLRDHLERCIRHENGKFTYAPPEDIRWNVDWNTVK